MDLRQLRYFIALAEHRSFVRAADAMGITQPAFSRSIQGLEQELGCQLVDRGSKDLRPTPEGQVVLQHALSLVQGSANLIHEIAQLNKLDAGELRFGSGPAPAQQLVPDAVADFINRHPRCRSAWTWTTGKSSAAPCSAKRSNSSSPTSATSRPTRTSRRAR